MSKERDLLVSCLDKLQYHKVPCSDDLIRAIRWVLNEPEEEGVTDMVEQEPVAWMTGLTSREALTDGEDFSIYIKGYARAEIDLKREPLSFEDLNTMWCGNPIDFARRIESIHGIGGEE